MYRTLFTYVVIERTHGISVFTLIRYFHIDYTVRRHAPTARARASPHPDDRRMFARCVRRTAARGAERAVSSAAAPAAHARGGAGASAARNDAPRARERGLRTLAQRGCVAPATARQGDAVACARDATLLRCSPAMYDARRGWKKAHRRVEVILMTPIDGLGDADETVSVRPGRARNHLVPGKLATYVNAEKLEGANARREARKAAEMSEDGDGEASGRGEDADVARERKVRLLSAS